MRITSGKYKGRAIKGSKVIRPTQGKVRKAIFDILGDIKGLSFLELFAGSGAVGLEALSQGIKEAVFVEKDKGCIKRIKDNLSAMGLLSSSGRQAHLPLLGAISVLALDSFMAVRQLHQANKKFDIIFLDPPYYKGQVPRLRSGLVEIRDSASLAKKTLQMIDAYDILAPNGLIIAQHFKKDDLPDSLGGLFLFKQAKYGDTILSFYRKLR